MGGGVGLQPFWEVFFVATFTCRLEECDNDRALGGGCMYSSRLNSFPAGTIIPEVVVLILF